MLIDFHQFRLWTDCNNNCKFCLHRNSQRYTIEQKLQTLAHICSTIRTFDHKFDISFIGGEIFDGQLSEQQIHDKFYELMALCNQSRRDNLLQRFMICTSLLHDVKSSLIEFIEYCRNIGLIDNLMICTSYDTVYRFKSDKELTLWENNLKWLIDQNIKVHTEMILTADLINKINSQQLNVAEFEQQHQTLVDFIEPTAIGGYVTKDEMVAALPSFFPTRQQFLDFVTENLIHNKVIAFDRFLDVRLRSKYVWFLSRVTGEWLMVEDKWKTECRRFDEKGKKIEIFTYSDSTEHNMIDDLNMLRKTYVE